MPGRRPLQMIFAVALTALGTGLLLRGSEQTSVRVAPMDSVGPRTVEKQTQSSVVRDYLEAWRTMDSALSGNRAELLDEYWVGVARDKLAATIQNQKQAGIQTAYRVHSHDIQVVFYSPEGLSLQLLDNVEYDQEVRDQGKAVGTQRVRARYVAVLTPAESKWKVRILQSGSQSGIASGSTQ